MSRLDARMAQLGPYRMAHLRAGDRCNELCNALDWAHDRTEIRAIQRRLADARRVKRAFYAAIQYLESKPL